MEKLKIHYNPSFGDRCDDTEIIKFSQTAHKDPPNVNILPIHPHHNKSTPILNVLVSI